MRTRMFAGLALCLFVLLATIVSSAPPASAYDRPSTGAESAGNLSPNTTYWVVKDPIPVARSRPAVASVNGKVYVLGGESATGADLSPADSSPADTLAMQGSSTAVYEYNPLTDIWTSKAPKPTLASNIGAGVINGKIYIPGGYTGTTALAVLEAYDPGTNSWSSLAPLPAALYGAAVAVWNGKLYVFGGGSGSYGNTCYVYAAGTNTWTSCATMPVTLGYAAAGVVNGKIYVVGGRDSTTLDFNYVEEYNPGTNTWASKAPMGQARGGPGAVGFGNYLYVCGGGWSAYLSSCERYSPTSNMWSLFDHLNVGRRTLGMAEAYGKLYAEAGYNISGYSSANEVYTLVPWLYLPFLGK